MARQTRPCIGIAADLMPAGKQGELLRLSVAHLDAVVAAGGLPLVMPPCLDTIDADVYLDRLGGIIPPGGAGDIDPRQHSLSGHPATPLLPARRAADDPSCRLSLQRSQPWRRAGLLA